MSEAGKDLFGKIDALFEKRAPDALVDKGLTDDDFPLLTEVLGALPAPARPELGVPGPADAPPAERRQHERRASERRLGDRRAAATDLPPRPPAASDEVERLVQAVEARLGDLFIRQQLRMEEAVRKVIREELDKRPPPPPAPVAEGRGRPPARL